MTALSDLRKLKTNLNGHKEHPRLRTVLSAAAAVAGVGAGFFVYALVVEPGTIDVEEVRLTLPRLGAPFDGYRVVQISDLHLGPWMPRARVERMVEMINEQKPDLVAITGDFITRVQLPPPHHIGRQLAQIRAPDGVFGVRGNHDYHGGRRVRLVNRILHEGHIRSLDNEVHTLKRDGAM